MKHTDVIRWRERVPGALRRLGRENAQRISAIVLATALLACAAITADAGAQVLTREQAVDALLDPASGVPIDPASSAVWSPFVDFLGLGDDFAGALPAGAQVEPAYLGIEPFPGQTHDVNVTSYFFWIDDEPLYARFTHATRFVFVNADMAAPSVANGGITVFVEGWWPAINTGAGFVEYFDGDRTTAFPPGFSNPDGLIAGLAHQPFPPAPAPAPPDGGPADAPANACAVIVRGGNGADFTSDVEKYKESLKNVDGVAQERITTLEMPTKQEVCDQLDALADVDPDCEKVFIRWTGHGGNGVLTLGNRERLTEAELCEKLSDLGDLGKPVCMTIDACRAGSMLTGALSDWDLPAGSVVIAATATDEVSWGGPLNDGDENFNGGAFSRAFTQCKAAADADADGDGYVSDKEAISWVLSEKPCYTARNPDWTHSIYPGGDSPKGDHEDDDKIQTPQVVEFGGPTVDRVIAKIDRAIAKLTRGIRKIESILPDPTPEQIEKVVPQVIAQLEATISQLEDAISQIDQILNPPPPPPPVDWDRVIAKIQAAINQIKRAIAKLTILIEHGEDLGPEEIQELLNSVLAQINQAIAELEGAIQQIEDPQPTPDCAGDITGDGEVNVFDLLELLAAWGPCDAPTGCPADLTGDDVVNVFDLLELLSQWGSCPEG